MEKRPSEIITEFLNFLETSKNEYESAYEEVGREDSKTQTFIHDIELAPNKNERNKVATKFQQSRRARRRNIYLGIESLKTVWSRKELAE